MQVVGCASSHNKILFINKPRRAKRFVLKANKFQLLKLPTYLLATRCHLSLKPNHHQNIFKSKILCGGQNMTATAEDGSEMVIEGLEKFLNSLKWDANQLIPVIIQHVDTGEVLMQAFADRNAIAETLQTKMATFYSRSRKGRWCKGETSGNFIKVLKIHLDCDRDSIIYIGDPIGPTCHTNAENCYFYEFGVDSAGRLLEEGNSKTETNMPKSTLLALEETIEKRRCGVIGKKSWTVKLLSDTDLLCDKIKEEASELCQTLTQNEGAEQTSKEMADLLYHAMVLLNKQGVSLKEVLKVLRGRFGVSGIDEKASRKNEC